MHWKIQALTGLENKKIKFLAQETEKNKKRGIKMSLEKGRREEHEKKVEKIILDMWRKGFQGYSHYNPEGRR